MKEEEEEEKKQEDKDNEGKKEDGKKNKEKEDNVLGKLDNKENQYIKTKKLNENNPFLELCLIESNIIGNFATFNISISTIK